MSISMEEYDFDALAYWDDWRDEADRQRLSSLRTAGSTAFKDQDFATAVGIYSDAYFISRGAPVLLPYVRLLLSTLPSSSSAFRVSIDDLAWTTVAAFLPFHFVHYYNFKQGSSIKESTCTLDFHTDVKDSIVVQLPNHSAGRPT
jgi:hypothetical protein